jgi:hypothetical protein
LNNTFSKKAENHGINIVVKNDLLQIPSD